MRIASSLLFGCLVLMSSHALFGMNSAKKQKTSHETLAQDCAWFNAVQQLKKLTASADATPLRLYPDNVQTKQGIFLQELNGDTLCLWTPLGRYEMHSTMAAMSKHIVLSKSCSLQFYSSRGAQLHALDAVGTVRLAPTLLQERAANVPAASAHAAWEQLQASYDAHQIDMQKIFPVHTPHAHADTRKQVTVQH